MKILIITRAWNEPCGAGVHGELIGRELAKTHEVVVSTRRNHGVLISSRDEGYVHRNFYNREWPMPWNWRKQKGKIIDYEIFGQDYDLIIVENYELLPMWELYKIFNKSDAKIVLFVHEGGKVKDKIFYKYDFDEVFIFDERYIEEGIVDEFRNVNILPYPYHPIKIIGKEKIRKKFRIGKDENVIFTYYRIRDALEILPILKLVDEKIPLKFMIITRDETLVSDLINMKSKYPFLDIRWELPSHSTLYEYLGAADFMLSHRPPISDPKRVVIASMVNLTLGSLTPIMFPEHQFVHKFDKEIIKYRSYGELRDIILDIFEGKFEIDKFKLNARKYVERYESKKIVEKMLKIINLKN